MNTPLALSRLDTLAGTIDRSGFGTVTAAVLNELRFEAVLAGVSIAVADVLVDPTAPDVVRNRAFGFIATALDRHSEATPVATAAA